MSAAIGPRLPPAAHQWVKVGLQEASAKVSHSCFLPLPTFHRYFCVNGTKFGCPAGTFQSNIRKSLASDCGTCTPGGYCGNASAAPINCGNDSVYVCRVPHPSPVVPHLLASIDLWSLSCVR